MPYRMSVLTAFEAKLFSHALVLISEHIELKTLSIVQNVVIGTIVLEALQLLQKPWNALTKSCLLGSCASRFSLISGSILP